MITRIVAPTDETARAALMDMYYHGARGYERGGSVSTACKWAYFLLHDGVLEYDALRAQYDAFYFPTYIFDAAWMRLAQMVEAA